MECAHDTRLRESPEISVYNACVRLPVPPSLAEAVRAKSEEDRLALGQAIASYLLNGQSAETIVATTTSEGWDSDLVVWWISQTHTHAQPIDPFVEDSPPPFVAPPIQNQDQLPPARPILKGQVQLVETVEISDSAFRTRRFFAWILALVGVSTSLLLLARQPFPFDLPFPPVLLVFPLLFCFLLAALMKQPRGFPTAIVFVAIGVQSLIFEPFIRTQLQVDGEQLTRREVRRFRAEMREVMPGGILDGSKISDSQDQSPLTLRVLNQIGRLSSAAAVPRLLTAGGAKQLASPAELTSAKGRKAIRETIAQLHTEWNPTKAINILTEFEAFVQASFGEKLQGVAEILEAHKKYGDASIGILKNFEKLLVHLEQTGAEFDTKSGRILFDNQKAMDTFSSISNSIVQSMDTADIRHGELVALQSKYMPTWTKFIFK